MKIDLDHIEINAVSKIYLNQQTPSLKDFTLKIPSNTKFGILGPNGAGKTTLISIMCGLIEPTYGEVQFVKKDNSIVLGKELKKSIGFVPQEYAFYQELTPVQNLKYFGALYGILKKDLAQRIEDVLEILGLTSVAHKKIHTFSGGMKRRVNLAIGIIHRPSILFLDEPTVGVDVQSKFAIIQLLEKINLDKTTIIYTSHHLSEAQNFCDQIAFIDKGQLVCSDDTQQLLNLHKSSNLEELFLQLTGQQLRD